MKFAIALAFAALVNARFQDRDRYFCKVKPSIDFREAIKGDEIFGKIRIV